MGSNRTVGIGMDDSACSKSALRWAIDNLVDSGDRIILIHVHSSKADHPQKKLWESTGSPLIPLDEFKEINISKQYGLNPDPEVLDILDTVSRTKQVKVVCKIYWGDPREKLCDAVGDLKLNSLVVGSRGLGKLKRYAPQWSSHLSTEDFSRIKRRSRRLCVGTLEKEGSTASDKFVEPKFPLALTSNLVGGCFFRLKHYR